MSKYSVYCTVAVQPDGRHSKAYSIGGTQRMMTVVCDAREPWRMTYKEFGGGTCDVKVYPWLPIEIMEG